MDELLQQLITERDELKTKFEPMRERIQRLDAAIAALQGETVTADINNPIRRRKNVKSTVIDIISRAGDVGSTVSDIIQEADTAGVTLEKTSVSTLVSSLKRSGSLIVHDGRYLIAPEGTPPETSTGRGRKRKDDTESVTH